MDATAEDPPCELLIRRQIGNIHYSVSSIWSIGAIFAACAGHGTGNQTAVITPVEAEPRGLLRRLVLQVSGLIEKLVVVNAEYADRARRRADTGDLRAEEARRHAGHHHKRRHGVPRYDLL